MTDRETAHRILLGLSETVAARMRRDHQAGSCVSVAVRTNTFANMSQQLQAPAPITATLELYRYACQVFDRLWDGRTPLRLLCVGISHLVDQDELQPTLFGEENRDKLARADEAIDRLRQKFGKNAVIRASLLQSGSSMAGGASEERRGGLTKPLPEEGDA